MTKGVAALMLSAALLFGAAPADAQDMVSGLQGRPPSGSSGCIALASKSKAPQNRKNKAKRQAAAKRKAAQKKSKRVIALAKSKLGKRYATAADGPTTFDCSGFTMYAYRSIGISLSHYAKSQGFGRGRRVSRSKLRRGDLVFFNTSKTKGSIRYHVGIYLGGGSFIHASSSAKKVTINSINYGFYRSAFLWGKRLF